MVVAGYLHTRRFSVILPTVDQVAIVAYDLADSTFRCTAPSAAQAYLVIDAGEPLELTCTPVTLDDFCAAVHVPIPADE